MKLRPLSFTRCAPSPLGCVGVAMGGGRRRTVLVALRRDAAGRELLTWALVKAAAAGDRVIALHVSTTAAGDPADGEMPAAAAAAEEEKARANDSLASVLGAYRGFCERNQIDLELKLCEGSSIKKALVAEATSCAAAHLIVGVTKSSRPSGSSATAVARYCAKRVPASCMVTAVSNGAVVYRRDPVHQHQHHQLLLSPYSAVVETPRRLYRKILDARTTTTAGDKSQDDMAIGDGRSLRRNMSAAMSALVSPRVKLAPAGPARSCHGQQQESPKMAAGWPLLKKDNMPALPELSEVSVVEWAMQLPTRCSDQSSDEREEEKPVPEELVSLRDKYSSKYTVFRYSELAKITNGFSPDRLVGKGGAGRVYRGCTEGGKELAVKVLKASEDVVKDFMSEIEILSSVEHENAMSLVGFCLDGGGKDRLMLVYDYMPRGSLEEVLHGHGGEKQGNNGGVAVALGWPERYRVAAGVARALEYLHGEGDGRRPMIHRDIKSSNILVAGDFEPKLCDFGIAMWADDAAAQVTGDDVAGTFGYLAPEYFMHGKVSEKMDVYAFGVVLLELISGRKPVSAGGDRGKGSLVMWANSVIQGGNIMDLVDPTKLPTMDADGDVVERMTLAAALCIRRSHQLRPSMSNVVKLLAGDDDAVSWAKSELGVPGDDDDDDNDGRHGYGAVGVTTSPEKNDIQSYINLALRDVIDDDASSVGSGVSLEEYLKGRWSRSSSFEG
ncbi:probable receptor-like serine/threonine-protein kinase At5g57670 [Sorghum bicolor]|nr:probable receptor-like serine/threonine-protein kinase At5g57670 [Sorghum bicolor]|eukprot:XP_002442921.1 probable receptor-like serine/threonine-protein kinase At5g57670 [Sorghum bicolor]